MPFFYERNCKNSSDRHDIVFEIKKSHQFCYTKAVPENLKIPRLVVSNNILNQKLHLNQKILRIIDQTITPIFDILPNDWILIFCDSDLTILKLLGNKTGLNYLDSIGIKLGRLMSEESCGTTALSLVRNSDMVILLSGPEHYCNFLKNLDGIAGTVYEIETHVLGYICLCKQCGNNLAFFKKTLNLIRVIIASSLSLFGQRVTPDFISEKRIFNSLSPREREVCLLMLKGMSSKEIATKLKLQISTVNSYKKYIYQKLEVNGFTGLLSKVDCFQYLNNSHQLEKE